MIFNELEQTRESQSVHRAVMHLFSMISTFANKYKNTEFYLVIFGLKLYIEDVIAEWNWREGRYY